MPNFKNFVIVLFIALLCSGVLSACGKRANMVDAPPDITDDHFPRIYPDPATDPKN